jgi:hypothetical protein
MARAAARGAFDGEAFARLGGGLFGWAGAVRKAENVSQSSGKNQEGFTKKDFLLPWRMAGPGDARKAL